MREAPESVKYHGGFDPADPPRGSCSECGRPEDECECHPDDCGIPHKILSIKNHSQRHEE